MEEETGGKLECRRNVPSGRQTKPFMEFCFVYPSRHNSFKVNIRSLIPWKKRKSFRLNLERYPAKQ